MLDVAREGPNCARRMRSLATVERYLAALPGGIDAYPECVHKGASLALWLERSETSGLAERLPLEVAPLLTQGTRMPTWVPEVHATVLYLGIREAKFDDDEAFVAHARARNREVLDTPTNRLVFWVASPRAILRGAGLRWGSLHRGTSVEVRLVSDTSAHTTLTYPPRLFPETVLRGTATGFTAALENAGARDVVLDMHSASETQATFSAAWR